VRLILAPAAYTPLLYTLACIMPAKRADLIFIPFVHQDVTVRAKILILCHPRSADIKKSHGRLLCHEPLTRGMRPTCA
jgi:hypothetical protein